ncbi:DUF1761 domain-containing protein [Fictibacillus aquaticus]|uniref:DUF1761 domain-containing protein n=1 Tax=Fictibacillus aquaticus TaxID=2021314 RepID=A0A235F7T4_9BACL|nr:DUF1761 domain-containing protein [Fictibacillus aquaticus]OYD57259.1 hypothetical protein CGZ90_11255 [Fictibacillus aquaticus]
MVELQNLNLLAVLAGGFIYMLFGALYYSPIAFGKTWTVIHQERFSAYGDGAKYGVAAAAAFISSFLIAVIVNDAGADSVADGLVIGLILGLLIAVALLKNMMFGMMPKKAYFIAAGDHAIIYIVLAVLHAVWR